MSYSTLPLPPAMTEMVHDVAAGAAAGLAILRMSLSSCIEYKLPEPSIVSVFTCDLISLITFVVVDLSPVVILYISFPVDAKI